MKIYTKKGDSGQTDLYKGGRVSKADERIEACGWLDLLSVELGMAKILMAHRPDIQNFLKDIQQDLIGLGSTVSSTGKYTFQNQRITEMEVLIDQLDITLPPLKTFVLPGVTHSEVQLHKVRSICRIAEAKIVKINDKSEHSLNFVVSYLNRPSDLLFVLARTEEK